MDGSRFDTFTRTLVTSRRGALKLMLSGAAAEVAALIAGDRVIGADDAEREAAEARRNPFHRGGKRCDAGQLCGQLVPCTDGRCTPVACLIDGARVEAGQLNADNPCEVCSPTASRNSWNQWTSVADGGTCDVADGDLCQSSSGQCTGGECVRDPLPNTTECGTDQMCCNGRCCASSECCGPDGECAECVPHCDIAGEWIGVHAPNPANRCQFCDPDQNPNDWSLSPDKSACGGVPGRVCCNGECCSPTECCTDSGICEECGPHCLIDDENRHEGEANPANHCEVCKPENNDSEWSLADDQSPCGDDANRECCNGTCCPLGQCCRSDRTCGSCQCDISGDGYDDGEANPGNDCEVCDFGRDRDDWSPQPPNSSCGNNNDRNCCDGRCCPDGECCKNNACETCDCHIGGQDYPPDTINEFDSCKVCKPDRNRFDWSPVDNDSPCGDDDGHVCCGGTCCDTGECCIDGACQFCPCEIDGQTVEPGAINTANSCQFCKPAYNRFTWSPVDDDTTCGSTNGQVCCDGLCCPDGQCCLLGACGDCLCSIENVIHPADEYNTANECQVCKPKQDPFEWTTVGDGGACGAHPDQQCCSGNCCPAGKCCNLGTCGECGCVIGNQVFAADQVNPQNTCQICKPDIDRFSWTPQSNDTWCGPNRELNCCNGVCCPDGQCCLPDGACGPCFCTIDGQDIFPGRLNPANDCEYCSPPDATDRWTVIHDDAFCGPTDEEVCCSGICCAAGQCCSHGTCKTCGCEIDGQEYAADQPNPSNGCEVCKPSVAKDAWTTASNDAFCGPNFELSCCNGLCCPEGQCCVDSEACGPCICTIEGQDYFSGRLNPANDCEYCAPTVSNERWTAVHDDSFCGETDSQVCCVGLCCPDGQCCKAGHCETCNCDIEGTTYAFGASNPANNCQFCEPVHNPTGWSSKTNDAWCGPNSEFSCCNGVCCPDRECCLPGGACGPCICSIEGVDYFADRINPATECEVCKPSETNVAWTPLKDDSFCGETLEQVCCGGECCVAGKCCDDGTCVDCGCTLGDIFFPAGTTNPDNECESCDPSVSETSWTPRFNNTVCGANQDRACCDGSCCSARGCCSPFGDGECSVEYCGFTDPCENLDPCGCTIDGAFYENFEINPANECQRCNVAFSPTSWDSRGVGPCGPNGEQWCCNGICCDLGVCCNLGTITCDPDYCKNCVIDGHVYRNGDRNPSNGCEQCSTTADKSTWSLVKDNFFCTPGGADGRLCCVGTCCAAGEFCNFPSHCEVEP